MFQLISVDFRGDKEDLLHTIPSVTTRKLHPLASCNVQQPGSCGLDRLNALGEHYHVIVATRQATAADKLIGRDQSEVHGRQRARLQVINTYVSR